MKWNKEIISYFEEYIITQNEEIFLRQAQILIVNDGAPSTSTSANMSQKDSERLKQLGSP